MQMESAVLKIFQMYFGETVFGIIFILSVVYCLIKKQKYQKILLLGLLLLILILYNDLSKNLLKYLGGDSTYYRFIWIFPVTFVIAYTITDILNHLKKKKSKIIFCVGILAVLILNGGIILPKGAFVLPENKYNMPDDVIQVSAIIDADYDLLTDEEETDWLDKRVAFPVSLEMYVRSYNASISYGISREAYLYLIYNGLYTGDHKYITEEIVARAVSYGEQEDAEQLKECLDVLGIKYLVTPIEFNMETYLQAANCTVIGYSENYTIYKVEHLY